MLKGIGGALTAAALVGLVGWYWPEGVNIVTEIETNLPAEQAPTVGAELTESPPISDILSQSIELDQQLAQEFLEPSEFPEHSWPITEGNDDLFNYQHVAMPYSVVGDQFDQPHDTLSCQFQAGQSRVHAHEHQQRLTLKCRESEYAPVTIDIESVSVILYHQGKETPLSNVNQKPIDFGWEIVVEHQPKDQGDVFVEVKFSDPDSPGKVFSLKQSYQKSSVSAAHFTGNYRETADSSGLTVLAELSVALAGDYQFVANLNHLEGPIGVAYFEGDLEEGTHEIPFEFYGLMFQQQQVDGPFELEAPRGTFSSATLPAPDHNLTEAEYLAIVQASMGDLPAEVPVAPGPNYETEFYRHQQFTDQPYYQLKD